MSTAATTDPQSDPQPTQAPARQPSLFAPPPPQAVIPTQILDELALARKTVNDLGAQLKARDATEAETKATLAKLGEQIALSDKQRAELASARRADAIRAAATMAAVKLGAVSESQLVKLVLDELDEVDGKIVARAAPDVSAEDHIAAYLKANPHLAKPKVAAGAGASPYTAAAPGAAPPPDLTTNAGLTAYARSLTYARRQDKPPA